MKRLFMTAMAVLSMGLAFAGNDIAGNASNIEVVTNDNVKAYQMDYNVRRLGETLGLTTYQMNSVEALNRNYRSDIEAAKQANENDRKALLTSAVAKELRHMSYILTPEQFAKYQTLINVTLANLNIEM